MSARPRLEPLQLHHGSTPLALHPWRDTEGPPLLLLHELHGNAETLQGVAPNWPGPVFALDLSGHGLSGWREGGAYSPELFAADADAAVAEISRESAEPVILAGEGVGAYAALLLAGGRPESVRAAILAPGRGLDGGGAMPDPTAETTRFESDFLAPGRSALALDRDRNDPRVAMAAVDLRPPDYASQFAQRAKHIGLIEDSTARPPWWTALHKVSTVRRLPGSLADALESFDHE